MNFTPIGTIPSFHLNDLIIFAQLLIVVQRSSSGKAATKTASGDTGAAADRHSGLLQELFLIRGRYP